KVRAASRCISLRRHADRCGAKAEPRWKRAPEACGSVSSEKPAHVGLVVGQLTTGGAEGQLFQLARSLDRARFEPFVYCLSAKTEPIGERLREAGIPLRTTERRGWTRIRWLAETLAADGIAVAHAWLYIANANAGAVRLLRPGLRLITSARNCKV